MWNVPLHLNYASDAFLTLLWSVFFFVLPYFADLVIRTLLPVSHAQLVNKNFVPRDQHLVVMHALRWPCIYFALRCAYLVLMFKFKHTSQLLYIAAFSSCLSFMVKLQGWESTSDTFL